VVAFKPEERVWRDAARMAYEEINTPRSLSLFILLCNSEFLQLANYKLDPIEYNSKEAFQKDFLAVELLRKFDALPGLDARSRKKSAIDKALSAEDQCLQTNKRVLDWTHGSGFPAGVESLISRARHKITHLLRDYDLDEHLRGCRWGPGSDALNKRPYVAPYHKFKFRLSGTRSVMPFLTALLEQDKLWATWLCGHEVVGPVSPLISHFRGNGAFTVPKTALTDRFICIEPAVNIYFQLGLGQMIRRRLRGVGIDLSSQEANRMFALEGSEDSSWATIDLSSASDTVARRLVHLLFSDNPKLEVWLRVMESLRSPFTNYGSKKKDEWLLNHKFSSMGNGFTFELETLIFWALSTSAAESVGGKVATVYGDDIIVSKSSYVAVTELLELCGFSVNQRKSFNESYFRESCGMNAWDGYEIPSYRLESLENLADCYSFHNGLRRCGLKKAASIVHRRIPASLRYYGPSQAGDVVLHSTSYDQWNARPHGFADSWFFWSIKIRALKFEPAKHRSRAYEPALLHSLSTLVPLTDHPIYVGGRWGSEGVVTLSKGEWTVGEVLVGRSLLLDVPPGAFSWEQTTWAERPTS
jgi:hypothetical protein